MSKPRAGLSLMVAAGCAYGTAPDWLVLLVGLLGFAATLSADARYLRRAIARRHFSFLIDRAILASALALAAGILASETDRLKATMRRDMRSGDAAGQPAGDSGRKRKGTNLGLECKRVHWGGG